MSSDLIIWLPEDIHSPWAYQDGSGQAGWARTDEERRALAENGPARVRIICPGQWVRTFPHDLPTMRAKERQSAAGYAIEDQLAAPLSDQHVVLGVSGDDRIAVISTAHMDAVISACEAAGLVPDKMAADFDVLGGDTPRQLLDREVHPGPYGYALDMAHDGAASFPAKSELDWSGAINLLQGPYQFRDRASLDLSRLTRTAALLAVAGVSWMVWQGAQIRAMNAQTETLKADMADLYTQATGQTAPANVASVVNRARAKGQGANIGFLDLSDTLFQGLAGFENVMIDTMRYDRAKNEIVLRLIYPDFESATLLENTYSSLGYEFRSGAVREQGSELIGEAIFKIRGGA